MLHQTKICPVTGSARGVAPKAATPPKANAAAMALNMNSSWSSSVDAASLGDALGRGNLLFGLLGATASVDSAGLAATASVGAAGLGATASVGGGATSSVGLLPRRHVPPSLPQNPCDL
jgi:hypothetical protein